MAADIIGVVREGTKKWTKTVKAEERSPVSRSYRYVRMTRERGVSFKDAAAQIMPEAYRMASGNGTLPANARQIMYAARPHIQKVTGKRLDDNYFTQTLLPDFLNETGVLWDICYDARGHFNEPHGGKSFGVGTLQVRSYLAGLHDPKLITASLSNARVETRGPSGNFGAVLFVEKEGFDPLLNAARIADKFDLAITSNKGMSVIAERALADEMCHEHNIPLLLLHDFDKAGFSIAGTLQRDTRRYKFQNSIRTVDLGLNLEDVEAMGLESEHQFHPKGTKAALMANLRENGATAPEIAFMFADFDRLRSTRRVELNSMTSPQFIVFLERKLKQHGINKVVPDQELLAEVYAGLKRGRRLEEALQLAVEDIEEEDEEVGEVDAAEDFRAPKDLPRRVRALLKRRPTLRWDEALAGIENERLHLGRRPPRRAPARARRIRRWAKG
jgi:hypothetical protein